MDEVKNEMLGNYHGERAVTAFAKDVVALADGVLGRDPADIDFEAVKQYLELLSLEAERIQDGIYAKDNSILYTSVGGVSFEKHTVESAAPTYVDEAAKEIERITEREAAAKELDANMWEKEQPTATNEPAPTIRM